MKVFITVILLFMLALTGGGTVHFASGSKDAAEVEACVVQDGCIVPDRDVYESAVDPLDMERCLFDMEGRDMHTLAHRVGISAERLNRFISIGTSQFMKSVVRVMAARMNLLAHCSTRIYDTLPGRNRKYACEHYVFGMRRILI